MKLQHDVRSNFNHQELYGAKGEEVKVIADYNTIWIVENESGNRYSVKKDYLSHEDVTPDEPAEPVVKAKIISKPAVKIKKVEPQQNTLF